MRIAATCGPNDVWYEKTENGFINWMGQGTVTSEFCFVFIEKHITIYSEHYCILFSVWQYIT
jgi:hypothetical protein